MSQLLTFACSIVDDNNIGLTEVAAMDMRSAAEIFALSYYHLRRGWQWMHDDPIFVDVEVVIRERMCTRFQITITDDLKFKATPYAIIKGAS